MHPNMKMHFYQITLTAKTSRPGFTWLLKELKLRSIDLDCVTKKGKMKQKLKKQGGAQKFWRWVFFLQIYKPIEIEIRGPSQSTKQWKGLVTQKGESTTKATHSGANCSKMDGWHFLKKCRWWRESCLCLRRCKRAECCKLSLLSHTKEKKCFRQQIYCGIQDWTTVSIAVLSRASLAQSSVF